MNDIEDLERQAEESLVNWRYCRERGFNDSAKHFENKYNKAKLTLLFYAMENVADQESLQWRFDDQSALDCAIEYFRRKA